MFAADHGASLKDRLATRIDHGDPAPLPELAAELGVSYADVRTAYRELTRERGEAPYLTIATEGIRRFKAIDLTGRARR